MEKMSSKISVGARFAAEGVMLFVELITEAFCFRGICLASVFFEVGGIDAEFRFLCVMEFFLDIWPA